jgi:hypothetical protein
VPDSGPSGGGPWVYRFHSTGCSGRAGDWAEARLAGRDPVSPSNTPANGAATGDAAEVLHRKKIPLAAQSLALSERANEINRLTGTLMERNFALPGESSFRRKAMSVLSSVFVGLVALNGLLFISLMFLRRDRPAVRLRLFRWVLLTKPRYRTARPSHIPA